MDKKIAVGWKAITGFLRCTNENEQFCRNEADRINVKGKAARVETGMVRGLDHARVWVEVWK